MRVAGLGFRRNATLASLREAFAAAGGAAGVVAVATVSDKANSDALQWLAQELGVPIKAIPGDVLAGIVTPTQSELVREKIGTGSVAEAAALAAAGRHARLVATRVVSRDRSATAAIAEGEGT